jgi:hypothetical protein
MAEKNRQTPNMAPAVQATDGWFRRRNILIPTGPSDKILSRFWGKRVVLLKMNLLEFHDPFKE